MVLTMSIYVLPQGWI